MSSLRFQIAAIVAVLASAISCHPGLTPEEKTAQRFESLHAKPDE